MFTRIMRHSFRPKANPSIWSVHHYGGTFLPLEFPKKKYKNTFARGHVARDEANAYTRV